MIRFDSVRLVGYGNAVLAGIGADLTRELDVYSTWTFQRENGTQTSVVGGGLEWIHDLRERGAHRLYLAGGITVMVKLRERWESWGCSGSHCTGRPFIAYTPTWIDLATAKERLRQMLEEQQTFALRHKLTEAVYHFTPALRMLGSTSPIPSGGNDPLPPVGYPLAAHQVVAAVSYGMVSGGMGGWRETLEAAGLEKEYDELMRPFRGFSLVTAVDAAANSFETENDEL